MNWLRIVCYKLAKHHYFEMFIMGVILLSSVKLAIDTYTSTSTATEIVSKI